MLQKKKRNATNCYYVTLTRRCFVEVGESGKKMNYIITIKCFVKWLQDTALVMFHHPDRLTINFSCGLNQFLFEEFCVLVSG